MRLPELFYKTIYHPKINFLLRNGSKVFKFLLNDSLRIPVAGTLKIQTKTGDFKIATNQTSFLTKLLFWEGYRSFEYSDLFESLIKKCNTFIDIGANLGYYSLLGATVNKDLEIYALEPALGPKYYLQQNIEINKLQGRIKNFEIALSDQNGVIDFYEVESTKYASSVPNLSGEHNAGTKKTSRNFIKNSVTATTFSHFISNNSIQSVDLIKIDTEGTEVEILNSGADFIKQRQPIIICETLFNTTETKLQTFFSELDYDFYNHTDKGLELVHSIERTVDNGVRNCFFVPKSKTSLISEYVIKTAY